MSPRGHHLPRLHARIIRCAAAKTQVQGTRATATQHTSMFKYKHKSGDQKRKRKEEEEKKRENLPKIGSFFKRLAVHPSSVHPSADDEASCSASQPDTLANVTTSKSDSPPATSVSDTPPTNITEEDITDTPSNSDTPPPTTEDIDNTSERESEGQPRSDINGTAAAIASLQKYPTDRGHFSENVDAKTKRYIIAKGSCRPPGPFPRDPTQGNRCFSTTYYTSRTKSGLEIPRTWLCYSPKLDETYCETCWLFADRSVLLGRPAWKTNNWRNLSTRIHSHETSSVHTAACVVYDQWRLHGTIDAEMEKQMIKEASFWRQVLDRLINVTLTLATNNMAFRGHREIIGQMNSGNFLSLVELMAKYDPVLK